VAETAPEAADEVISESVMFSPGTSATWRGPMPRAAFNLEAAMGGRGSITSG
jgi:hypothetical protein